MVGTVSARLAKAEAAAAVLEDARLVRTLVETGELSETGAQEAVARMTERHRRYAALVAVLGDRGAALARMFQEDGISPERARDLVARSASNHPTRAATYRRLFGAEMPTSGPLPDLPEWTVHEPAPAAGTVAP